jgi:hypothetical protein
MEASRPFFYSTSVEVKTQKYIRTKMSICFLKKIEECDYVHSRTPFFKVYLFYTGYFPVKHP